MSFPMGGASLDYYLILGEAGGGDPLGRAEGIAVEEFVFAADHTAAGVDGAGWTAADGGWWSSAAFTRAMRSDPRLRARIVPAARRDAESVYRRLGGGDLPGEAGLRGRFLDRQPLAGSAPLDLGAGEVPDGFHDRRVYRILFAGDPGAGRLPYLLGVWGMTPAGDPSGRLVGRAGRRTGDDLFGWELRRIGPGVAWCVDVTACLAGPSGDAVGPLLRELTAAMRHAGLIPVTIERFT
ncbi:hypothetical protein Misp01_52790 [Microtetraspora sp. NBRC 13810]|uniref:hypothetical protein n=1 Tax=Microtetraspora sp. NBRC 13810 TaxID=3030990 RepID=UPI002557A8CA|nr:hypothetical protein [Microtetraspora sp. NBRC 13810]GLW10150.1 hypothetical protein Misp01_52790 [Microtetraspora sp. NBRC 13810]